MDYISYALAADVASFMGKTEAELPANIESLIAKASDLITNSIMIEITTDHTQALNKATCAQVEYWIESGDQVQNSGQIQSYSAGSTSVTYANKGSSNKVISSRARSYLARNGLLYRGIRISDRLTERSDE